MSFFIDNIWSYFHLDILSTQWIKLEEALTQAKGIFKTDLVRLILIDFDEMRKIHDMYLNSISSHTFLNFPKIVKYIYQIVQYCRRLVNLVAR